MSEVPQVAAEFIKAVMEATQECVIMRLEVGQVSVDRSGLGRRDAFHVPGMQCVADVMVHAGQWVMVSTDGQASLANTATHHGVIDPFIKGPIQPGTLFWVFLDPAVVQDVRHHVALTFDAGDGKQDKIDELKRRVEELESELADDECRGCY